MFDPAERHHEAKAAIAALEAMRRSDPGDARATGDLLLAYRLAERMEDVVRLLRQLFWAIWYPAAYWMIAAGTSVVALPIALSRQGRVDHAVWRSPDR